MATRLKRDALFRYIVETAVFNQLLHCILSTKIQNPPEHPNNYPMRDVGRRSWDSVGRRASLLGLGGALGVAPGTRRGVGGCSCAKSINAAIMSLRSTSRYTAIPSRVLLHAGFARIVFFHFPLRVRVFSNFALPLTCTRLWGTWALWERVSPKRRESKPETKRE